MNAPLCTEVYSALTVKWAHFIEMPMMRKNYIGPLGTGDYGVQSVNGMT